MEDSSASRSARPATRVARPGRPEQDGAVDLYDLTRLKATENFSNGEMRLRIATLFVACVALVVFAGDPVFLIWYVLYLTILTAYVRHVQKLPAKIAPEKRRPVFVFAVVQVASFMSIAVYLWAHEGALFPFLALLLVVGGVLNTIANRIHDALLLTSDKIVISGTFLVFSLWQVVTAPMAYQSWVLVLSLGLFVIYFWSACGTIRRLYDDVAEARQQVYQAEKRQAIDRLTGGFAHDFNNLLTAVLGNLELQKLAGSTSERDALIAEAEKAAQRGAALTQQLLVFSQRARLQPETVSPRDLIFRVRERARADLDDSVVLAIDVAEALPDIYVDMEKLSSALAGLVVNAAEALNGPGTIRLEAQENETTPDLAVSFVIGDDGVGIPDQVLPMVFEPYFSTKPVGQGSGLGLSMARGLVEQSGGSIEIASTMGVGTQVFVHLPSAVIGARLSKLKNSYRR